jgi:two-component system CheB/CheR fusion protein
MRPFRILVLIDLSNAAETIRLLLTLRGHKVVVASGGEQALAAAARIPPRIVLLDMDLPDLDGYEVARQLRQLPGMTDALLVALSGQSQKAEMKRYKEAGIDYHFRKPVVLDQLQQVLAKAQMR